MVCPEWLRAWLICPPWFFGLTALQDFSSFWRRNITFFLFPLRPHEPPDNEPRILSTLSFMLCICWAIGILVFLHSPDFSHRYRNSPFFWRTQREEWNAPLQHLDDHVPSSLLTLANAHFLSSTLSWVPCGTPEVFSGPVFPSGLSLRVSFRSLMQGESWKLL